MEKLQFQPIGDFELIGKESNEINNKAKIILRKGFEKAIIGLSNFSHIIIYTKLVEEIKCYTTKIKYINESKGEIIIDVINIKGEIVDIKPYFPCEERIQDTNIIRKKAIIPFKGNIIGNYVYINKKSVIRLQESKCLTNTEIKSFIELIDKGDYLRVLWWFHKYDKKDYRKTRTCNPPYENAPRCGVFATRSPIRPNPLASTVIKVKSIDKINHTIEVNGFDGFENTKILQIMSYNDNAIFDDVKVPDWVSHWTGYKTFLDSNIDINSSHIYKDIIDNKSKESIFLKELEPENNIDIKNINSNEIIIENASIHNLKDISVKIPKDEITVITGVSGSGKSSLAFDTIYNESRKQFMDLVASNTHIENDFNDSNVKKITGLQPAIAIEQRNLGMNPRSTVGSVSRIGDYLRLLYSTIGERICPYCNETIPKNNVCSKCGSIFFSLTPSMFSYNNPDYMCPVCKGLGEEIEIDVNLIVEYPEKSILDGASLWWGNLRKFREKPNANWMKGEVLALAEDMKEDIEIPFKNLSDDFKKQLFYGSNGREVSLKYMNSNGRKGNITRPVEGVVNIMYRLMKNNNNDKPLTHLERFIVKKKCSRCNGERLIDEARLVKIANTRYPEAVSMSINNLRNWCHTTYDSLSNTQKEKSKNIFIKILYRLKKIEQVGLSYLSLNRSIPTLSGGEAQRLKIATQFGSSFTNVLYIMDEPSKGLHPKDYKFLIKTIRDLKKLNNTIIMVEHKNSFKEIADYIIEIGPRAGKYGGALIRAEKSNKFNFNQDSDMDITKLHDYEYMENLYLDSSKSMLENKLLKLTGITTNNLKNIDITVPLSKLTCIVGVSGSGKSSLISETLYPAVLKALGKKTESIGIYKAIIGVDKLKDVHYVSQKPIGKTPRSNPGTYTGVFDLIRNFYAGLQESKENKLTKEHFSFNSKKGQCPECKGAGQIAVPMHFMPDIYTVCSRCKGKRYLDKVLAIKYKGYSIADLLELEIKEVKEIFKGQEKIYTILNMLEKVGVSYIKLGQSATTLSGGEAQRIKLAKELCLGKTKDVLYILDEPTTGLHDIDVQKLINILRELTNNGSTVIVIEHNPMIIKKCDYIIEMGPEGGDLGGYIVKEGWLGFDKNKIIL
ncbi:MAG: TrmO family methyltransferase [Vallitalea sp.]|jgi:excinuclease ABC A subunit|nr:TrmO family methyltransferase [Vallitalea sp.]